jgi:multicomponent K+:H+ antiporter subunit E
MSAFVMGTWLMLNQSLAPGHLLAGCVLGVLLGLLFDRLQPPRLSARKHLLLLRLAGRVALDVLESNVAMLRSIVSGRSRVVHSGFVPIPLELTDPYGLAVLGCIITATPGTIWVSYRSDDGVLLIHVFDLVDNSASIATITQRYEQPLKEIFE